MACKNICETYWARKNKNDNGRYSAGQKRCQTCEIFINWDGLRCPCCSTILRTTSRTGKYKAILKEKIKCRTTADSLQCNWVIRLSQILWVLVIGNLVYPISFYQDQKMSVSCRVLVVFELQSSENPMNLSMFGSVHSVVDLLRVKIRLFVIFAQYNHRYHLLKMGQLGFLLNNLYDLEIF